MKTITDIRKALVERIAKNAGTSAGVRKAWLKRQRAKKKQHGGMTVRYRGVNLTFPEDHRGVKITQADAKQIVADSVEYLRSAGVRVSAGVIRRTIAGEHGIDVEVAK